MEDLNELKQVWLSANINTLPDATAQVKNIKRYHLKQMLKTIGLLIFASVLFATMVWVLIDYNAQFISTRIGEAFILTAIIIILSVAAKALKTSASFND